MTPPYPLRFEPILLEKVWGGRRLAALGRELPQGALIGESWELADLDDTGDAHAPARSVIAAGPLAGRTIRDAVDLWGERLLGPGAPAAFPLLIKFLDVRENLSVQVHPSAESASGQPGWRAKTECWFVIDAQPDAVLYKGLSPGVDMAAALAEPDLLPAALHAVPARPGDAHLVPGGTVHALGAGVLIAEVQTPSDTTFRLHDWGRTGRPLHVAEARACARPDPPPPARRLEPGRTRAMLATCDAFHLEHLRADRTPLRAALPHVCHVLIVLAGRATIMHGEVIEVLERGSVTLVPAAVRTRIELAPGCSTLIATPGPAAR